MEEENPWLDPENVKHKNVKSLKPKPDSKKKDVVYIDDINKKEYKDFLDVLTNELSTNLPKNSEKFALEKFGENWLKEFLNDIEDLKSDIVTSKFFPSQKEVLFLKYIFLLNQSL